MRALLLLVPVLLAAPPALSAQADVRPASTATLGSVGLLTAGASFVGGFWLGAALESRFFPCDCDDPGLYGGVVGALTLPPLLTPIAVHAANRGRGSLAAALGGSILAGGAAVLLGASSDPLVLLIAPPLVELAVAVAVERATTR